MSTIDSIVNELSEANTGNFADLMMAWNHRPPQGYPRP